ncbi:MAG: NAD(+)/NADH kinase [Lachnospiraceae bacterium]|jgi:NAD+ kinase|nr:NAD(+)/NADH kinase [Lachnospiraceae bacterium]
MDKFFIITNENKDGASETAAQIRSFIEKNEKSCVNAPELADLIIVLGGDGTLLRGVAAHGSLGIPFLGINLGYLGFLTEVTPLVNSGKNSVEAALQRLFANQYDREERMMLTGIVGGENNGEFIDETIFYDKAHVSDNKLALNDIVIASPQSVKLIYFSLYVNGVKLTSYVADGLIVSTPTGSTGYNLSAGGPIAPPCADIIILTPLCAHSMRSRTIILSADDEVAVEIELGKKGEVQTVEAVFDGHYRMTMKTGERITITKAMRTTTFVKLSKTNFLETLKEKL